jgi:hypothetical protein
MELPIAGQFLGDYLAPLAEADQDVLLHGQVTLDMIGELQDAGAELLIQSDRRNDLETLALFPSEVLPRFA